MAPSQSATSSQSPAQTDSEELSWEGDRMFNIYIYDYCYKRGYRETARALLNEAELPSDSQPPINAKQGLLFEWWSVFWVLFTAKSNGSGPEEALLYTNYQMTRPRDGRRFPNGGLPPGPRPGGPGTSGAPMSNGVGPGTGPQQSGFQQNGAHPNGQPNGVANGPSSQQPPQQGSLGPNAPNNNINGAPNAPPGGAGPTNSGVSGQQQQQQQLRPPMSGNVQGQQGRPPHFQSPTMGHSPANTNNATNNSASNTAGQPPGYSSGAVAPGQMAQNIAHMTMSMGRGVMPPPGANGAAGQSTGNAPTPPQPNYSSSSRAATPAQGQQGQAGMTQPSPSLSARQIQTPTNMTFNINNMAPGIGTRPNNYQDQLTAEVSKLDPALLGQIRNDLGMDNKEILNMTVDEKNRVLQAAQQRNQPSSVSGPSQQTGRNRTKRNSTSPGDEEIPKNDSSPPERKRVRRSPNTNNLTVPANASAAGNASGSNNNAQTSGPNAASSPMSGYPQGPNNMMRPGPANGVYPQQGQQMNQQMNQQMHHMSPGMSHMVVPGGSGMQNSGQQMTQQLQQMHYQKSNPQYQNMHTLHKMGPPQMGGPPSNDPTNPSSDSQYNTQDSQRQGPPFNGGGLQPGGPQNANARNKPIGMMPPPSSPLNNNGMQKSQQGAGKSDGASTDVSSSGSPHVTPATAGAATAPATPTSGPAPTGPAPSPSQILNNNRFSTATPTITNSVNPSRPSTAIINNPAPPVPVNQPTQSLDSLSASLEFMQGTFDDFDFNLNNLDGNFDDISAWFNPGPDLEV